MSDYYWNEYIKYYLNEELLRDTIKYHQKTTYKENKTNLLILEKAEFLQADAVQSSDVQIKKMSYKNLSEKIKKIIVQIGEIYETLNIVVSIPVLINLDEKNGLEIGSYSIDMKGKNLLKLKDFIEKEKKELEKMFSKQGIIIALFLNIEKALALYEKKGYVNGIKEIGHISYTLRDRLKLNSINEVISEQKFTHYVGLNIRKCLLIDEIFIPGGEDDFC